ncbi:MAG: LysM peptidoglycan-binding domain-containing protein, partial [Planctomycetales bacterium]|nr:LysM peptidoglycan-binding domain-containing protein [Planctomycetales bacterium]
PAGASSEGGAELGTVADPDPSAVAPRRSADEVAASEIETAEEPVTAPGDLPLPPVEVIRPGEARAEKVIPSGDSTPGRTMYRLYVVRPGDSLWRISDKYLNDGARWREIFDLNRARLETPDRLPVGTELLVPRE